jgi:hypothetical protein
MSVSYGGSSITFEDGSIVSSGSAGFKNKIINGAMMIDQRYGYSTATNVMWFCRWTGFRFSILPTGTVKLSTNGQLRQLDLSNQY